MADVFISYRNTPDRRAIVRRLAAILRAHEVTVWWDYGLEAGESYRAQITAELAKALVVAPLWCAESVVSKWVQMEAEFGKDKLVPARLQKVVPPDAFEAIQAADLVGWDGAVGAPRVLAFVRRICERLDRAALAPTDMIEELAHLPLVTPLPEVAPIVPPTSAPGHDYAFWKSEWDAHRSGTDLGALRAIADHAPPYFASQAQIRLAEIEASSPSPRAAQAERGEGRGEGQVQGRSTDHASKQAAAPLPNPLPVSTGRGDDEARWQAEGRIKVEAAIFHGDTDAARAGWLKPGAGKTEWFKDLDIGPEMVVVPSAFQPAEGFRPAAGVLVREGTNTPAFAIGRFAVTFAEWDAAQAHPEWKKHTGIEARYPYDHGWTRRKQPLIDINWNDAKAYCAWASAVTGKTYRLPSEAEWEQACRAGTKTEFWWGNEISTAQANYDGNYPLGSGKKGEYRKRTVPVDSFEANPWGLYQVHGNVWEWCEGAYDASSRVVRGGSWVSVPDILRASYRGRNVPGDRSSNFGFRVARVLSPARTP